MRKARRKKCQICAAARRSKASKRNLSENPPVAETPNPLTLATRRLRWLCTRTSPFGRSLALGRAPCKLRVAARASSPTTLDGSTAGEPLTGRVARRGALASSNALAALASAADAEPLSVLRGESISSVGRPSACRSLSVLLSAPHSSRSLGASAPS